MDCIYCNDGGGDCGGNGWQNGRDGTPVPSAARVAINITLGRGGRHGSAVHTADIVDLWHNIVYYNMV